MVAFRTNRGRIQRILSSCNSHKTGTLFKCLGPQLGNLQQLLSVCKCTVFLPVGHNIFGNGFRDSFNIFQKRSRSCIQIHADPVYTVLHYALKGLWAQCLWSIVLILPYANGLGINFYQLCQRILKTSCNRSRASLSYITLKLPL